MSYVPAQQKPRGKDKPKKPPAKPLPKNYQNLNWFERNLVWPFAYGGDAAMNDMFGPRGIARPVTEWAGLPPWEMVTPEPEDPWGQVLAEVPRGIITSGGLLGAASIPRNVVGGAISGYARDPGPPPTKPVDKNDTEHRRRLINALFGGSMAGIGGVAGHVIGHRIPEAVWGKTFGRKGWQDLSDYTRSGEGYKGAKAMHADPARFAKSLDDFPTASGTFRRGVRVDHPTEFAEVQKLKVGDTWKPGSAKSVDHYGPQSNDAAWGRVTELDTVAPGNAVRGPYLHIRTNNGRNVGNFRAAAWDEVVTTPGASYKVTKVIRDKNGNVTDVWLTDLSKPSVGRNINDIFKTTTATGVRTVGPASARDAKNKQDKNKKKPGINR